MRAGRLHLYLFHAGFAEQAGGAEEQDDDEDGEGDGVLVGGPLAAVHEGLDGAEEQAAEGGAGDVADAAEHGGDEGLEAGHDAHQRVDRGIVERVEDAAGAGGILYALNYPSIDPLMGVMPGLKAFVAAVLGGIGNIPGAALGGLLLGTVETFVNGSQWSTYKDAIAFAILIIILLFRPAGLLGKASVEKV